MLPAHTAKINVAIDGFAGCGKSTLAKDLAGKLSYLYIDSGAMYRAVALYLINQGIQPADLKRLIPELSQIQIAFRQVRQKYVTFLNGNDVEEAIRSMAVNRIVSDIAAISEVRRFLVKQQQVLGQDFGVVMDGRDIGTVVFPDAGLKIFLTAKLDVRIDRRLHELQRKGLSVSREDIKTSLVNRDRIDTTRQDSPLVKAPDAIALDNSDLTRQQQLDIVYALARKRIQKKSEMSGHQS